MEWWEQLTDSSATATVAPSQDQWWNGLTDSSANQDNWWEQLTDSSVSSADPSDPLGFGELDVGDAVDPESPYAIALGNSEAAKDQGIDPYAANIQQGAQLHLKNNPRGFLTDNVAARAVEGTVYQSAGKLGSLLGRAADAVGADMLGEALQIGGQGMRRDDAALQAELNKRGVLGETVTSWIQGGLSSLGEAAMIGATGGGLPAVAAWFAVTEYDKTLADTGSHAQAAAHGSIEGAFTLLGGKVLGAGSAKLAQKLAGGQAGSTLGGRVAEYLVSKFPLPKWTAEGVGGAGGEVLEEALTEGSHYLADVAMTDQTFDRGELLRRMTSVVGPSLIAGGMGGALSRAADVISERYKQIPAVGEAIHDAQAFAAEKPAQAGRVAEAGPLITGRRPFEKTTGKKKTSQTYREAFVEQVRRLTDRTLPEEAQAETATATAEPLGIPDRTEGPSETIDIDARTLSRFKQRVEKMRESNAFQAETMEEIDWLLENRPDYLQGVFSEAEYRAAEHNAAMNAGRNEWTSVFGVMSAEKVAKAKRGAAKDGNTVFKRWDQIVERVVGNLEEGIQYPNILAAAQSLGNGDVESGLFTLLQESRKYFRNKSPDEFVADIVNEAMTAAADFNVDEGGDEFLQRAYHGSPYKFDKFSTDKIGTGEGAQAYGHGLYFSSQRDVAEFYRRQLEQRPIGTDVQELFGVHFPSGKAVIDGIHYPNVQSLAAAYYRGAVSGENVPAELAQAFDRVKGSGALYTVDLKPTDEQLLDWDKPLSEQSEKVREVFEGLPLRRSGAWPNVLGRELYQGVQEFIKNQGQPGSLSRNASKLLHSLGIRGIKYKDEQSRGKEGGTHNYVIFDDADIDIEEVYEQLPVPENDAPFELSGEGSKDTSPVVEPYQPDRIQQQAPKHRQPTLEGMPEDFDESVLRGQQALFQHANPREPRGGESFTAQTAEPAGQFTTPQQGVPLPELVELAKELLGKYPSVGRLRTALGRFVPRRPGIDINAMLGGDPSQLAATLAHEIGHLFDWLPDKTNSRGNILGRIGSLRKHMGSWLAGRPGGDPPLTDADRERLRGIAEQLAAAADPQMAFETIEREITRDLAPVTAQDILAIWNSIDQAKLNPALLQYVKGLSAAEKLSIVKEAMKGVVREDLQQFAQGVRETVTETVTVHKKPTKKAIDKKWQELIAEEIRKRELLSRETISEELKNLTKWWSGDYSGAKDWYKKYRESSVELYAEALSVFLNSPGELAARAPEFYRGFSNWISEKPEVFREYMRLQDILNGTPESIANRRQYGIYDMFERGEEKIRAAREAEKAGRGSAKELITNFFGQYVYDALSPAKALFPDVGTAIYTLDELFTQDSPNEAFLSRVDRLVSKPLTDQKLDNKDLGAYLFLGRIAAGDRSNLINPLGHTPQTAQQQLDHMRRGMNADQWRALENSAQQFHDLVFDIGNQARDAGLFTPEQFDKLVKNRGNYATFWITDYIDRPHLSPLMKRQVGTFKETANPFTNTLLKTMALNRLIGLQKSRNVTVDQLKASFPSDIRVAEVAYKGWEPAQPAGPGNAYLHHFERGQHVVYEVPSNIAKSFKNHDIGGLQRITAMLNSKIYGVFHPLYVTSSAGFQAANPFRDIGRAWKNRSMFRGPDIVIESGTGSSTITRRQKSPTFLQILRSTIKNFDVAYARARGRSDPRLEKLFEEHVLGSRMVDVMGEGEDTEYERLLKEHGIANQYSQKKWIRRGQKIMAFLEAIGTFQETAVKAGVYDLLQEHGVPTQERAYLVRKYVGTPDFYQRGHATTLFQFGFMYARVKLNGLMADAQVATGRQTAASWWWSTAVANLLPTTLTRMALWGVFGPAVAEIMSKFSSGLLDNYIVIPLGLTGDEDDDDRKGVALSIPMDDTGRMLSTLWGNLLDATAGGGPRRVNAGESLQSAFGETFAGLIPSANPLISITDKWVRYGMGHNPVDPFRNREIIPRGDFDRGGWSAARKMFAWTADQFGVASDIAAPITDMAFGQPFDSKPRTGIEIVSRSIPGVSRLFRVTDAGVRQEEWAAVGKKKLYDARMAPESAKQLTRERYLLHQKDTLTDKQQKRRAALDAWYRTYLRQRKAIKATEAAGKDASALRRQMDEVANSAPVLAQ